MHNLIDLDNFTDFIPNLDLLENITNDLTSNSVELIICENEYIKELNNKHRQKNISTDVLSFPIENEFNIFNFPLGSIIISIDYVNNKSKELGHNSHDEFILLYIHGLLHLLGYDHEIDNGEHRKKEEEIVKNYSLPKSLIVRNT